MRHQKIFVSALCFAFVTVGEHAFSDPTINCPPVFSGQQITVWRDQAIAKLFESKPDVVTESLAACFPTVPKCLEEVKAYAEEELTGDLRIGKPTELMIESELDLPPEFLVKNTAGQIVPGQVQIPKNIFELAVSKNWKVIDYKTRSTGGFDNPPNLVLIVLPNYPKQNQDIYLQISPKPDPNHFESGADPKPSPQSTIGQKTLTIITADKTVNPPVGQLRLLSGGNSLYSWNNDLQDKKCTSCHSVPLRAISPRGYGHVNWDKPMSAKDQKTVTEINKMMQIPNFSWGNDELGRPFGERTSLQPYGWAPVNSKTRTKDFISECFDNRDSIHLYKGFGDYTVVNEKSLEAELKDWTTVRDAMNCVSCHNNKTRGYLHSKFSFQEIEFKVLVDRSMPPDADLNTDERLALLRCLKKEFQETSEAWKKSGTWMKKVNCGAQ